MFRVTPAAASSTLEELPICNTPSEGRSQPIDDSDAKASSDRPIIGNQLVVSASTKKGLVSAKALADVLQHLSDYSYGSMEGAEASEQSNPHELAETIKAFENANRRFMAGPRLEGSKVLRLGREVGRSS